MDEANSLPLRRAAHAASLLEDVSYLVSPPDICVKVFELVESNDASAQELGEVIGRDPSSLQQVLVFDCLTALEVFEVVSKSSPFIHFQQ